MHGLKGLEGLDAIVAIVSLTNRAVVASNGAAGVDEVIAAISARLDEVTDARPTLTFDADTGAGAASAAYLVTLSRGVDPDERALVAIDITARKREEARLRRSEAMLVDTQGVAHLGTWEWDITEPHAKWSPELYRIYAETPETYTPSYEAYLEKVHPDDRGYVKAATERVFNEHLPYSHDERIRRPDGSIRYLHTWAFPIKDGDKLVRLVGVCQDITDRKLAEIALAERAEELARSNERLRAEMEEREKIERRLREAHKLEAIGRLAGGVAHDFNNLLSVVLGRAGLLERLVKDDARAENHIREIVQVARQAARLTQQLLVFSRENVVSRELLDVSTIVLEASQVLERLIGEDFVIGLDIAKGCVIEADRSQVEQVLMNLAMNARDAMPSGGAIDVKLHARPKETTNEPGRVRAGEVDPTRDYVVLTVGDQGVGMSEATLGRIFDPFFTTKEDGHGLGLSTVYGIVRQLGGAIVVKSAPGAGSTFAVYLPTAPLGTGHASARGGVQDLRGAATILVVEDQESVRNLVRIQLEDLGYRVLAAGEASHALELAADPATRIDLLLTDVVMPRVDGRRLAGELKEKRPALEVLYMSGWIEKPLLTELEKADAPILRKPFTHDELGHAVRRALRGNGA